MGGTLGEAGGTAQFDTVKARRISRTMDQMQGVGGKEARSWVRYWSTEGFLRISEVCQIVSLLLGGLDDVYDSQNTH